jgi:hypothetical protein
MNEPSRTSRLRLRDRFAAGAAVAPDWRLVCPQLASELRHKVTDSARRVGQRASDQYQQASTRVGAAVDELARQAQGVRDDAAEAVASGARQLERFAVGAKSDRG